MLFSIPIYIEERPAEAGAAESFLVRPLFVAEPQVRAEKLSRALSKLTNELQELLRGLGQEPRHEKLARWAICPVIEDKILELRLELAKPVKRKFFLAGYTALGRRIFFTPKIPALHFELLPGQDVAARASAAIERHLRDLENDGAELDLDEFALTGKGRLTLLEINLEPAALVKKPQPERRAFLFGQAEEMDGERELRKVGRSLQAMYPDDLDRALGRDREVEELAKLLAAADRRPVVLVGPRKVGKTTILHELAWQIGARKKERFAGKREIWLVSPMRLISGMSVLGEWENRALAILNHAQKKDHVLYLDDLLGLFGAGVSSASNANVAQVLLPALEKRSVRVVAEITPESWRVLRERDRRFADLFQVIPVNEPTEMETLRALVSLVRQLEEERGCHFEMEIVPLAYELCRRFAADAAFPGKAAGFLKVLASRFAGHLIGRAMALGEFSAQSGLQLNLLDDGAVMEREEIVQRLRARVIGQEAVVQAFADMFLVLKARLNEPRRPLGAMLLLGPTGVGKTQAAKALAATLFGGEKSLLRFDMNEYVDASAVARLAGTPNDPEGLLTSAIRRQPFSVVLFDEIEKAAPEAFDLLLAVLDEGRLTDSLGRVADFSQSVILMTSNLGATGLRSKVGFGKANAAEEDAHYLSVAEKFFRPEFFNRLTRVIPFQALGRAELEGIARRLLDELFARDGLKRRDTILNVAPYAMTRLVELGHHPQLGARALKRVVEREVGHPVAARLAEIAPGAPLMANLTVTAGEFALDLRELAPAERTAWWVDRVGQVPRGDMLEAVEATLFRIDRKLETSAPSGAINLSKLSIEQERYFLVREQFAKVRALMAALARPLPNAPAAGVKKPRLPALKVEFRHWKSAPASSPRLGRLRDANSLRGAFDEDDEEAVDASVIGLLGELALLEVLASEPARRQPVLLVFRALRSDEAGKMFQVAKGFHECFDQICGVKATALFPFLKPEGTLLQNIFGEKVERIQALYLEGINVMKLFGERSAAMQVRNPFGLILMTLMEVGSEAEARRVTSELKARIDLMGGEDIGKVTHLLAEKKVLDHRTKIEIPQESSAEEFRTAFLAALPLPAEALGIFEKD